MVSNHQSYLDPLFCGNALKRPLHFVARDSLYNNFFFGGIIKSFNTIPIKRGRADLSAIKSILRGLKAGNGVCLFPEATRTRDGRIAQLKPGFSFICRKGNVPVVPVVLDGAFECWPRDKKLFSPGRIFVTYGEPILQETIDNLTDEECAAMLTGTLREMQNKCRAKLAKQTYEY